MLLLGPTAGRHKVVLECYPISLPLEAMEAHPCVVSARKLHADRENMATRQVLLVRNRPTPGWLDLSSWDRYTLRPY